MKAKPGVGWIRADVAADEVASKEILALRKRIEELQSALASLESDAPRGAEAFAQGDDEFPIHFNMDTATQNEHERWEYEDQEERVTWNGIFSRVAPLLLDEGTEASMQHELYVWIRQRVETNLSSGGSQDENDPERLTKLEMSKEDFQTIKVQLMALGLIAESKKKRAPSDKQTYWSLTPYGRNTLVKIRAIRRDTFSPSAVSNALSAAEPAKGDSD